MKYTVANIHIIITNYIWYISVGIDFTEFKLFHRLVLGHGAKKNFSNLPLWFGMNK